MTLLRAVLEALVGEEIPLDTSAYHVRPEWVFAKRAAERANVVNYMTGGRRNTVMQDKRRAAKIHCVEAHKRAMRGRK